MASGNNNRYTLQKSKSRRDILVESVKQGDWTQVLELLRHKPEGNSLGRQGEMLVHEAVIQSEIAILDFLLDRGVSPIATDSSGRTPLHLAAIHGHEHIIQHLLKRAPGVQQNINQVAHNGLTAYQEALLEGHKELAITLEKHGAATKLPPGFQKKKREDATHATAGKGYTDWSEMILYVQGDLETSLEQIKEQIKQMKESMDSAFSLMNSTMSQLMGKQDQSDKRLQRLQKKLTDVEQEVHSKTQELNEGVKVLVNNTNELRSTIRQAGEFNEYVYFRIFNRIAQKVGMEKNGWKKLNTALLEDYPETLMGHIQQDIHGHHTSEKDMAYESLTKWNLFNRQKPKKIETLKQALRKTDIDHLLRDIDEILEDYQKKVPQKPSDVIPDKQLMKIAKGIGNEWKVIGVNLNLSASQLEHVENDHRGNSVNRNFAMLVLWRDSQKVLKETMLATLVEALKDAKKTNLVNDILTNCETRASSSSSNASN